MQKKIILALIGLVAIAISFYSKPSQSVDQ
jgi:hypothetical protein